MNLISDKSIELSGFNASYRSFKQNSLTCSKTFVDILTPEQVENQSKQRIIGGVEANPHSLPWQTILRFQGRFMCGGVIISNRWVLSAAHCFISMQDANQPYNLTSPEDWQVTVGLHKRLKSPEFIEPHRVDVNVKSIHLHPLYTDFLKGYDAALLELSNTLDLNDHVQPVCVGSQAPLPGTLCLVSGFGAVKPPQPTILATSLQQVYQTVSDQQSCNISYDGGISSSKLCIGDRKSSRPKNACQGDSGGPIICNSAGHWELHGLPSYGYSSCVYRHTPSVSVKVAALVDWLTELAEIRTRYKPYDD